MRWDWAIATFYMIFTPPSSSVHCGEGHRLGLLCNLSLVLSTAASASSPVCATWLDWQWQLLQLNSCNGNGVTSPPPSSSSDRVWDGILFKLKSTSDLRTQSQLLCCAVPSTTLRSEIIFYYLLLLPQLHLNGLNGKSICKSIIYYFWWHGNENGKIPVELEIVTNLNCTP